MFQFLNISFYTISHALWCDVAGIRTTFKIFILNFIFLILFILPPDYSDINSRTAAFLFALLAYFLTFYTANKITQQLLEECRGISGSELGNTCCSPFKKKIRDAVHAFCNEMFYRALDSRLLLHNLILKH